VIGIAGYQHKLAWLRDHAKLKDVDPRRDHVVHVPVAQHADDIVRLDGDRRWYLALIYLPADHAADDP
jgi:hypothetical protein